MARRPDSDLGQASVEFVAIVPALLLATLIAAQIGLAGHALWSAANAARAGARAAHVGGDGAEAARRALPSSLRGGAEISDDDSVRVEVRVPALVPLLPKFGVAAETALTAGPDG